MPGLASFGVSPGLTPALIEASRKSGLPLLPGVMTPKGAIKGANWALVSEPAAAAAALR